MVFDNIKRALSHDDVKELESRFKRSINQFKEEFEDHLDAINQNTNEIQSNYEFLCNLDSKINKLNERIDELFMMFKHQHEEPSPSFEIHALTKREKEVFMALYALEEELDKVSYLDLARRLGMTVELVQSYISNLVDKGIPLLKRYINNNAYIRIDPAFKSVQAKKNFLEMNEQISEKVISYE